MASCREYRTHIRDLVAQAKTAASNGDYGRAEAYLISGLERGRGLTANKEGLLVTRLVGIACQKASLQEMESLYTKTSDNAKLQMARGQLQGLDDEMAEIRSTIRKLTE
jgi:hypothetical protein